MAKTISYGPNGTAVAGVSDVVTTTLPLNFTADFRSIEEGPSKVVYTDITAPQDRASTLRIAQSSRANIYSGTSIDPSVFLATKRGTDTIIEVRETHEETDSTDSTYLRHYPVRAALTLTLPDASQVTADAVVRLINRLVAAVATQGDDELTAGVTALLHGVVKK